MEKNLENLKDESSPNPPKESKWGGAREGAGRPVGSENAGKREEREALRKFKARVIKKIDDLFNSQIALSEGITYMYRVDEEDIGHGKKKRVHVLVTDPEEIKQALDDNLTEGDSYYYITTKNPDNKAIDSMLDRTFGKATQNLKLDEDSEPLTQVNVKIIKSQNGDNGNGSDNSIREDSGSSQELQDYST